MMIHDTVKWTEIIVNATVESKKSLNPFPLSHIFILVNVDIIGRILVHVLCLVRWGFVELNVVVEFMLACL